MDHSSGQSDGDFNIDPLEVIDPITWQGKVVPERQWIVPGMIPRGAVTLLTGDGGTGKSILALQLMACCAIGTEFLGRETTHCKTLGVFCEDEPDELHRRLNGMCETLGYELGDLENMQLSSRVGMDNLLMTFDKERRGEPSPFMQQLRGQMEKFGASLVIIDTAADVFGGNENVRAEVRQFLSGGLGRFARELDVTIVLISHPSVEGRKSGRGDGGSTAWSNSVRSRLYLTYPEEDLEEAKDPNARILSLQKANYAQAGTEMKLQYTNSCFMVEAVSSDNWLNEKIRRDQAETAFLDGMRQLEKQGARCNDSSNTIQYAPKILRERTSACADFTKAELKNAMHRLFRQGKIESAEDGPKSKRRKFLRIVEGSDFAPDYQD